MPKPCRSRQPILKLFDGGNRGLTPFDGDIGDNEKKILQKYATATEKNLHHEAEEENLHEHDPLMAVAKAVKNRRASFGGVGKNFLTPDAAGVGAS